MRIRTQVSPRTRLIVMVVAVFLYAAAYETVARLTDNSAIPTSTEMAKGVVKVMTPQGYEKQIWFWKDATTTYKRLFLGMFIGCSLGVFFGLLMGCYDLAESFFYPVMAFFSYAPSTAMIAVLSVYLGGSETMFMVLLCFTVVPALACKLSLAIRQDATVELVNKTYTLGGSHAEVLWNFIVRQVLPKIIDNIRLHMGSAMVAVIAAELLLGDGIGYRMRLQGRQMRWDIVYVYLIFLATSGFCVEEGLVRFRKFLCSWFDKKR